MNKTDLVDALYLRTDLPEFRPGDTVKVHVRVVEAGRERIQVFQGVVIRRQGGGLQETFTVRKISFGVGVERTFPLHSPSIGKLEVVSRGHVRRAKLYYLRERRGKKARIRERRLGDEGAAGDGAGGAGPRRGGSKPVRGGGGGGGRGPRGGRPARRRRAAGRDAGRRRPGRGRAGRAAAETDVGPAAEAETPVA